MSIGKRKLKRIKNPMPADIKALLVTQGLMPAYKSRPPYQQNDYLGWINRAKLPETREKRLKQMIAELKEGKEYMKMAWSPLKLAKDGGRIKA